MEKFIYRLALVTSKEVETMLPPYFGNRELALAYVEIYVDINEKHLANSLEEYCNSEHEHYTHKCSFNEGRYKRWYDFDILYIDNRVPYNRFLAITRIPVVCNE